MHVKMLFVTYSHPYILQDFDVILVKMVRITCHISSRLIVDEFRMLVSQPVPYTLTLTCGPEFHFQTM
jgi:hypothetical protein